MRVAAGQVQRSLAPGKSLERLPVTTCQSSHVKSQGPGSSGGVTTQRGGAAAVWVAHNVMIPSPQTSVHLVRRHVQGQVS